MFIPWVIFHILVCVGLILVVLMQSAKGEGLAGGTAFGGGMSGAVFGGRGAATFLSKATTVLAVLFMINCVGLAYLSAERSGISMGEAPSDSAITRQATAEREQALQRQAEQAEAAGVDTTGVQGGNAPVQVVPIEQTETPAGEPSGN